MFGWTYDNSSFQFPTSPMLACHYYDSTQANFSLFGGNMTDFFNATSLNASSTATSSVLSVPFNLSVADFYTLSCNVSNHVSWQVRHS